MLPGRFVSLCRAEREESPSPVEPMLARCGRRYQAGDRLGKPRDMEAAGGQSTGQRSLALPARRAPPRHENHSRASERAEEPCGAE